MNDLDVRRVVRDLLRSGLNVEETFDAILEELMATPDTGQRVMVSSSKEKERRRICNHSQAPFMDIIEYRVSVIVLPHLGLEKSESIPRSWPPAKWVNTGNGAGDEFGGSNYP